ncbi:MAG TPA: hypothetical protein VM532_11640, partial [Burkholderiales bacterium]|nr:hypothetical protein [Burkholderiales bacterium]
MKLIFIENESSITPLLASANYRMGEDVVVCLNYLAVIRLRKAGPAHRCVFCEELLGAEDYV